MILISFSSCRKQFDSDIFHDFYLLNSDTTSIPEIKKQKNWETLKSLHLIPLKSQKNKEMVHGWIKIPFTIDNAENYKAVFLDTRVLIDTLYINGTLIGSKNIQNFSVVEYLKPSLYQLPPAIIKSGLNEMLIYISSSDIAKGSIRSIELLTEKQYEKKLFWNNFFYEQLGLIILIIYFFLFIVQVVMYLVDRKIKTRLIYALFLLYNISIFISFLAKDNLFSGNTQLWTYFIFTYVYLGIPVLIIFLTILLQSLYRIYLSHLNRIFIPIVICTACVMILFTGQIMIQIILQAVILFLGFIVLGYMVYILNRIKPNPFLVRILIIEFFLFVFCTLWGTLSVPLELPIQPPDSIMLFFYLIYIFLAILYEAVLSKRQRKKIDRLYKKLKNVDEKKSQKSIPLITQTSEEKLESIIEFIKQNYTSDISREGLAAAVDMNTSYFSTLFNTYTGKKINEYIHSLRIKDAAELLEKTDDKIIEIAYKVGFDSLATFNRAFKNETGSTPTEIRKNSYTPARWVKLKK
jgi:AraC-like DNA-binding protein